MKKTLEKIKQAFQPDSGTPAKTPSDAAALEIHLSTLPPEAREDTAPKQPILDVLRAGIKEVQHFERQIRENEENKADAIRQNKILSQTRGRPDDVAQKIMDQKLRADLADAKDGPLYLDLGDARARLLNETRNAVGRFEREVLRKMEKLEGDLVAAVHSVLGKRANDFFASGATLGLSAVRYDFVRAAFDRVHFLHCPVRSETAQGREPRYQNIPMRSECREVSVAKLFISHATRNAGITGISLETLYFGESDAVENSDATIERAVRNALKEAGMTVPAAA